ncbi:MAG: hemerythrin domain-containing protein [Deltaproteobacteria bacterium]|nr:hemerythrin domain-containing protein [Deltaproteobacteria bacterium]
MRLIEELCAEHELIDAGIGALRTYIERRIAGVAGVDDGRRFVRFLRVYAAGFHHAREEDVLFPALVERADRPEAGPIAVLREDHLRTSALLSRIEALLAADPLDAAHAQELHAAAVEYSHVMWRHIDAENSVLFPESEPRLRRAGVFELPTRSATVEEAEARDLGRALVAAYPPFDDRMVVRGDGCVCCPALGESCPGLERAWWSDSEWEELDDHLGEG